MHQEIYIHRKPGKISFEDARYTQDSVMEKVLVNQVEPLKRELSTFWTVPDPGKNSRSHRAGSLQPPGLRKITSSFLKLYKHVVTRIPKELQSGEQLKDRGCRNGVLGIPAAMLFADVVQFEKVYGFQRESATSGYKIEMLNRGESPLKGEEPGLEDLIEKVVDAGKFECTSDFSRIAELDAVTLSIQTPFLNKRDLLRIFPP